MSESRRNERDGFAAKHSEADVFTAMRNHEPAGTMEVAEELRIKRPNTDYRLRQLEEEGK